MRKALPVLLLICQLNPLFAQSDSISTKVYRTNPKWEILPALAVIGVASLGFKELDKTASITRDEVMKLNPETINSFDRPVAFYDPANFDQAQKTSDLLMSVTVASPVLLLLDKNIRRDYKDFLSVFLTTHAAVNAVYFSSTFSIRRARPLAYNTRLSIEDRIGDNKTNSFFSGHTAWVSASIFLMAKMYTDYHNIKGAKRLLIFTGAAVPPAVVGYFRMEAGKHFKTDVITGLLVGAICGIGIPELHRIKNKDKSLSVHPYIMQGANGLSLTYNLK